MSAYEVDKFCRDCLMKEDVRALALSNPAEALRIYDLTDRERELMLDGQVGELEKLGANSFLMSYLPRWGIFGLNVHLYSERMRAVAPKNQRRGEEAR